jgi:heptosyltransferase-2
MKDNYKNILIVRTDRIGDVVLTTPAIRALRNSYPEARISILVAPQTKDIVVGNGYLDEVLVDDRAGAHKGWFGFGRLVRLLRQKRFDLAVILHTKRRTNLACFLAGIPVRMGYKNNKFGFLLNRPVADARSTGAKHEAQYCLDVLKGVGVVSSDLRLDVVVNEDGARWADRFKQDYHVLEDDRVVAVHCGASDPAKQWPAARFAELIDALVVRYSARVVMVGTAELRPTVDKIKSLIQGKVMDATGMTTVGQLAGLLSRCHLLISNDSGPVHLAAGVGIPVISIFTRNQPGINPERWRPLSEKSRVVSVSSAQSRGLSFQKAGLLEPGYAQLISTQTVLEAVDALFKLC